MSLPGASAGQGRTSRTRSDCSTCRQLCRRRVAGGSTECRPRAGALLGVEDPVAQEQFAHRIVAEGLSVRAVEEIVALGAQPAKSPRPAGAKAPVAPGLKDLADRLSDVFETRVKVELGQRKGKIVVEFASLEDLERIVRSMSPTLGPSRRSESFHRPLAVGLQALSRVTFTRWRPSGGPSPRSIPSSTGPSVQARQYRRISTGPSVTGASVQARQYSPPVRPGVPRPSRMVLSGRIRVPAPGFGPVAEMIGKSFGSDNHAGVHPAVLAAITEANGGDAVAYGGDHLTGQALARLCAASGAAARLAGLHRHGSQHPGP